MNCDSKRRAIRSTGYLGAGRLFQVGLHWARKGSVVKYTINVRCVIALDFEVEAKDAFDATQEVKSRLDAGDIEIIAQDCNGLHPELHWCDTEIYGAVK